MKTKTLLIDGEWNLRRNAAKREDMRSGGEWCGGTFGFLDSLRSIINKLMPDRVVVMWDGKAGGQYRKNIYPLYKSNRDRDFSREAYGLTDKGYEYEKNKKNSLLKQKIKVKNYLEELSVRQLEVPYIEGDDLIAGYVKNREDDEVVYILSADKDYYSLFDVNVNVIRPSDYLIISIDNFYQTFGYRYENSILFKCFNGDTSDVIKGIKGIGDETLFKYFPNIKDKVYSIDDLISEAKILQGNSKKPSKKLESIIECKEVFELNKKLMDLKENPFLNQEAVDAIVEIGSCVIVDPLNAKERSVEAAMKMFIREGLHQFVFNQDYGLFFQPFYRISTKELDFSKKNLT